MGGNTSVLAKEYGLSQSTVSTSCYIRAKWKLPNFIDHVFKVKNVNSRWSWNKLGL
jgi:hypothetical protein